MSVVFLDRENVVFQDRLSLIWAFSLNSAIESVKIIPDGTTVYLGQDTQFRAVATYSDGEVLDVTDVVPWSVSSSPVIAEFSEITNGLLTGLAVGVCTISVGVSNLYGLFEYFYTTLTIHEPLVVEQARDLVGAYRPVVNDYIQLFTSQYQNSTNMLAWARSFMGIVNDIRNMAQSLSFYFSFFSLVSKDSANYVGNALTTWPGDYDFATFEACVGDQLDQLGVILGVPRKVTFNPTDGSSPILTDDVYRLVLKNQVLKNHWDGRASTLQTAWKNLFPGGKIIIQDNQNMTVDVTATGNLTQLIVDLIENDYIVPRPQGVWMNYYVGTLSPSNLPFYGHDRDDTIVSGLDEGHWV